MSIDERAEIKATKLDREAADTGDDTEYYKFMEKLGKDALWLYWKRLCEKKGLQAFSIQGDRDRYKCGRPLQW